MTRKCIPVNYYKKLTSKMMPLVYVIFGLSVFTINTSIMNLTMELSATIAIIVFFLMLLTLKLYSIFSNFLLKYAFMKNNYLLIPIASVSGVSVVIFGIPVLILILIINLYHGPYP